MNRTDLSGLHRGHQADRYTRAAEAGLQVFLVLIAWTLLTLLLFLGTPADGQYATNGVSAHTSGPTVTNYVQTYWVTNITVGSVQMPGNAAGAFNYLGWTNGMLVYTNTSGTTNFCMTFNDQWWRGENQKWYTSNVWNFSTNYPDSADKSWVFTTNNQVTGQWWQNIGSGSEPTASMTVTATAWNTTTGWNSTNGPIANTNQNYQY